MKEKNKDLKKRKISLIALKFSLIVSILILVVMSIMASLVLQQTRQSFINEMEIRTQFFARQTRESLFPKPDPFRLYFAVQEMIKEKAILYAIVIDDKGNILSHNDKSRIGGEDKSRVGVNAAKTSDTLTQQYKVGTEKLYDVSVPILVGRVGAVRIGYSQKSINEALADIRNKIIYIALGVVGVSILATVIIVTLMVSPINKLAFAARQIGKGELETKVDIKRHDEFGLLAGSFNEMIEGLKERDFIRSTFGRYVTKQVAEAILNGRIQLGGERLRATVLISDIRNFTSMSEKLSPEEVVDFLNEYFAEMVQVVTKYEGTLDKFIGDAILTVFGVPIPQGNDAVRAVYAALEMREKLSLFNEKRISKGQKEINIGIAIHTGDVVAGNIGSEVRMEYTVIGDTVNLTSRLEKLNKEFGTTILITKNTYDFVKDRVEVREIPPVTVRGKENSIQIYDVIGRKKTV